MKKCILVAVRYSVLFAGKTKGFHLSSTKDDHSSYKEELFNEERMMLREALFKKFCFNSLKKIHQSNRDSEVDFHVVVMTSTELPGPNKEFLSRLEDENSEWMHVKHLSPENVNYGQVM